ncbi:DUF551 domain-containing protein [Raoultella ornithinolytica]
MTSKLTITRERLEKIKSWREAYGTESNVMLPAEEAAELARMALAAMDSEPVAYTDERNLGYIHRGAETGFMWGNRNLEPGDIPLYRHAQPAPVVPDNRAITQHFDTIALETAREIMCDVNRRHEFLGGEVQLLSRIQCRIDAACRAAMLQENPKSAGESNNCRRNENVQDLQAGNSPAHSGLHPEQSSGSPAQDVVYPAPNPIDHGYRPDCECSGCKAMGRICAELAGWIPVSERLPETNGNYWGWWSESKRQGPVWFIKSELQAQFQSHEITHWMPLPAAPQEVQGE